MKINLFTFTLISMLFVACGKNKEPKSVDPALLVQKTWELTTLHGKEVELPAEMRQPVQLILNEEDQRVNGFSGCNNFMGSYELGEKGQIGFSQLASTKMACPETDFNENEFLEILEKVERVALENEHLVLMDTEGKPLAVFKETEEKETADTADNTVVEKYWKLTELDGETVKMAENQEREQYFMLKTEEDHIQGFGGCNNFSGTYALDAEKKEIHFNQMAGTLKACLDTEVDEPGFMAIFGVVNQYKVEGDHLQLLDGEGHPLASFEAVYFD